MRAITLRKRITRAACVVLLGALVVPALPAGPASGHSGTRVGGPAVPKWGALFGTTVGSGGPSLRELERKVGRKFALVNRYYDWGQRFPNVNERRDARKGRISMVSWRSTSLDRIVKGKADRAIRRKAVRMRRYGHRIFLRWGWEMNGNWEPWCCRPRVFKRAWRHIREIFWNKGASNVIFVWAPNWESVPHASWNRWTKYYPGDDYVDWVGVDGFNWGNTFWWSDWIGIKKIVRGVYGTYHHRKPFMVAETASVENGGSKRGWIKRARFRLKDLADVSAFVYYNGRDDDDEAWWPVTSSPGALRAYRNMAQDEYWRQRA